MATLLAQDATMYHFSRVTGYTPWSTMLVGEEEMTFILQMPVPEGMPKLSVKRLSPIHSMPLEASTRFHPQRPWLGFCISLKGPS